MAQLVEHRVHIAGVTGSSPVATIASPDQERFFHALILFLSDKTLNTVICCKKHKKNLMHDLSVSA